MLLDHRSPLEVEVQRTALRVPSAYFRDDRVGVGEARLAVEQFGEEDEAFFPGGCVQVPREARTLRVFRFPDPFPFGCLLYTSPSPRD